MFWALFHGAHKACAYSDGMTKNPRSRRAQNAPAFDPNRPYNDLPLLPPQRDVESKAVLKACIEARAALAELKQAAELIPNQTVLINSIPLLEARDSSEIENIVTTTDELFREANVSSASTSPATKEALRYRQALYQGWQGLHDHPLAAATAVQLCQTIKAVDLDIRTTAGTKLQNDRTGEIIYTPPDRGAVIREKLTNWEQFLNTDSDLDPLVRMALAHYQFEAIHPFVDGNGRTGRIINILYLIDQGLLDLPILYLSRHILRSKSNYYRLLLAVTQHGAWEPWITYMLEAVAITAKWTTDKIASIKELFDHTIEFVSTSAPKIYRYELIELMFVQPYCRKRYLMEGGIATRNTATKYLKTLCELGVLEEHKEGRDKLFLHPKYLKLLTSDGNTFEPYVAPEKPKPRPKPRNRGKTSRSKS